MPEGDVVRRTAERLHAALAGRPLVHSDLRWPSLATVDLRGRTVRNVISRGKHLLLRVDGDPGVTLHSHLRMEGSWHVHRTGACWQTARGTDGVRAVLANAEWTTVGHRLGMLDLVFTTDESDLVGHLGPDVLGPDWDLDVVLEALARQPERPIGEALLDQRVLAGVGTMFMAESLFVQGVNPWTPAGRVGDPSALLHRVQRMMLASTRSAVQSTTGDTRHGQRTYAHGRLRAPCRRCGGRIRVQGIGIAPHDRVAFYCPICQPALSTALDDSPPG